jgi:hypothetical protein
MSNHNTSQDPNRSTDPKDVSPKAAQPESGFVEDREERMSTRQSSPTNPRVNDKPRDNQAEA